MDQATPTTPAVRLAVDTRRRFGVYTRAHAHAAGVADSTLDRWITTGRCRVLLPGVMTAAEVPDSWELRAMAALLAVGGEVVMARQSAAHLHDLDLPDTLGEGLALLVHNRTFPTLPAGIRVHRTRRLLDEHVRRVGPFPTTSPARTLCDLAGLMGPTALRRSVAHAVRNDLADALDLRTVAGGLGRIRGKRNLMRVCDELSPLEADCRSELESRFLRLVTRAGLEPTAMNHPVTDADGRQRFIDAVYLPHLVGIELDSKFAHGSRIDQNDDTARENAIVRTGWRPLLHTNWRDVVDRPRLVIETIRAELRAAEADLFVE